jgi:hypothetical protein
MHENDRRPEHLGWIETALRAAHPYLPGLRISGQSHYRQSNRIAFVDVFGIDGDHIRRRQTRAEASNMLRHLRNAYDQGG